jgi:hypothetical protein
MIVKKSKNNTDVQIMQQSMQQRWEDQKIFPKIVLGFLVIMRFFFSEEIPE